MCQETARSALPWDHAGRYSGTLSRLLRGNALEEQGDPHCQPWQHFAQRTLNSPISSGTHWWSAPIHATHHPGNGAKVGSGQADSSLPCDTAQINI